MWSQFRRIVASGAILLPLCGCQSLATLAHRCGCFLDQSSVCDPQLGQDCALCNAPVVAPSTQAPMLPPAEVLPAAAAAGCSGASYAVQDEIAAIRADANETRKLVEGLREELTHRNGELIETRKDYARVKNEVQALSAEVAGWQGQMIALHQKLREREAQRQTKLAEVAESLRQLIDERTAVRR